MPQAGISEAVSNLLHEIQKALYDRALKTRLDNTTEPKDYVEFKAAVEHGFALAHWCGSATCEAKIKEETKATMRCIPLEQSGEPGVCIFCAEPSKDKAIFARAY